MYLLEPGGCDALETNCETNRDPLFRHLMKDRLRCPDYHRQSEGHGPHRSYYPEGAADGRRGGQVSVLSGTLQNCRWGHVACDECFI